MNAYENIAHEYAHAYDNEMHAKRREDLEYWYGKRHGIASVMFELTGKMMYASQVSECNEYRYYDVDIAGSYIRVNVKK